MTRLDRCLTAQEQAREATQLPIVTVERYTVIDEDGNEVEQGQSWADGELTQKIIQRMRAEWSKFYSHAGAIMNERLQ